MLDLADRQLSEQQWELFTALDAILPLAEAVDAERGRTGRKISPNDTTGTDLAESLNQLRARVHMEVHGAAGRD